MRIFVIADASKRKAKPVGVLTWKPCAENAQGRFSLEVASDYDEARLPLSLSFCASRKRRRATPEESEDWVRSRIVPESRHNIGEVLAANGLADYDEIGLLTACKGRSSDDDLLVYEVEIPEGAEGKAFGPNSEGPESLGDDPRPSADEIISAVRRQRTGKEVRYAFIDMRDGAARDADGPNSETAAKRAGALIRSQRKDQGLTQRELAARAGITQTVLSRVESGAGNPTLALLEDLAEALGAQLAISLDTDGAPSAARSE